MAEGTRTLELANLICRFGDKKVLLDHFEEIVYPSFTDRDLRRTYGETSYFFEQVRLLKLSDENNSEAIGICGRLIKDTKLRREQVYVEGEGLLQDHEEMQSSPSALFLLVLNCHRLVYAKETSDGPSKESFRSTLLSFLRQTHSRILTEKCDALKDEGLSRKDTRNKKEALAEKYQKPTLELVALTSGESIEEFINSYELLTQIKIAFADRNDETDLDDFFEQVQKAKDDVDSKKTTLIHTAKSGLDKEAAINQVTSATAQGNQNVTLVGSDESGDRLVGNNEKFQLKTELDNLNSSPRRAANQMFKAFSELVASGRVRIPNTGKKTLAAIERISARYLR
jgi:hypothetical protein